LKTKKNSQFKGNNNKTPRNEGFSLDFDSLKASALINPDLIINEENKSNRTPVTKKEA